MSPHLARLASPSPVATRLELLPCDFESQEVTEIDDLFLYEAEVTEPIVKPTVAYQEAQNRSPSSTLSFLFRVL